MTPFCIHFHLEILINDLCFIIQFEMLINSPSFQRVLLPYSKNLAKVGIDTDIRIVDRAQYKVRLDDFELARAENHLQRVRQGQSSIKSCGSRAYYDNIKVRWYV